MTLSIPIHIHLPQSLQEVYESKMEKSFQSKYVPGEVFGKSGGRLWDLKLVDDFLSIAQDCAKRHDYIGQVIVIMMGTNDCRALISLVIKKNWNTENIMLHQFNQLTTIGHPFGGCLHYHLLVNLVIKKNWKT